MGIEVLKMTKESIDAVIGILEDLYEVSKTDSEKAESSYISDYFKGCASAYKIAIDTIKRCFNYGEGGDI